MDLSWSSEIIKNNAIHRRWYMLMGQGEEETCSIKRFIYRSKLAWETKENKHKENTPQKEVAVLIYFHYFLDYLCFLERKNSSWKGNIHYIGIYLKLRNN